MSKPAEDATARDAVDADARPLRPLPLERVAFAPTDESTTTVPHPISARAAVRDAMRRCRWFALYLAAMLFEVVGNVTPRYPDSTSYLSLNLGASGARPPTVPLLYVSLPNDATRVFAQTVIAAISWWVLARAAALLITERRVRVGLRVVLLALGLVYPIAEFNTTILSDSVTYSLTVLMLAAWLTFASRPTWRLGALGLFATFAWVFAREENALLAIVIVVIALGAALHRRDLLHLVVVVGLGLTTVLGLGLTFAPRSGSHSQTVIVNLAATVSDRILPNPEYTQWFVDHGMPDTPAVQKTAGVAWGLTLAAVPEFATWANASGSSTYLAFMASHPGYTFLQPLSDFTGERPSLEVLGSQVYPYTQPNAKPSMLSPATDYGRLRHVLPDVVEGILWEPGQVGDLVWLAVAAVCCAVAARRRMGADGRVVLPALIALSAIPQGYIAWWFGSDGDTDRHGMVAAISLRVALWVLLAVALDRLVRERDARRATGDSAIA